LFPNKINQISDPIHGSIKISQLEKNIISTQVFNRMHHILQNSTVYLTFPSNKTSRFSHSLGVMHLGGEIFKYSVANSGAISESNTVVRDFLNHIGQYLQKLTRDPAYKRDVGDICSTSEEYNQLVKELSESDGLNEPFYSVNSPKCITKEVYYWYVITYQSVRCVALLHDLGHPPFSHITEDALDNVYSQLLSKPENTHLTEREKLFIEIVGHYKKSNKLHEVLGRTWSDHIFDLLIKEINLGNSHLTKMKKVFYLNIKYISLAIFDEVDDVFKAVHKIVDGVLDCDRLDYVSRDIIASGFNDGIIEYDRLISTMKLLKDGNKFVFCPSSSSTNTIEDFLRRRWKLYKYVINHHRVAKTDTLLRTVIEKLSIEYLSSCEDEQEIIGYRIPNNISGLWKTVDAGINITAGDYINHLIQWDDAWLLACLRGEYFKRIRQGCDSDKLIVRLEELLSNKKKFSSLYMGPVPDTNISTYCLACENYSPEQFPMVPVLERVMEPLFGTFVS